MDFHATRRGQLLESRAADGVDAYLVTDPTDVAYLSGYRGPGVWLLVAADRATLVPAPGEAARAAAVYPEMVPAHAAGRAPAVHPTPAGTTLERAAGGLADRARLKAVGVDGRAVSVAALEALTEHAGRSAFRPVPSRVRALRAVKDPLEVEEVRAAAAVAGRAFGMFSAMLRERDTEREMAGAVDEFVRRAGGDGVGFPAVVSLGERGAVPDAPPAADRQLAGFSKLLVDFCPVVRYACRVTKTIRSPFGTAPVRRTKAERVGYDFDKVSWAVTGALDAALQAVRAGRPAREVDAAARKLLAGGGLAEYAVPVTGHGTGLEPVESPVVSPESADTLEVGAVVTLRPGVRIPGWGAVVLSETVLVTRDGAVPLTADRAGAPAQFPPG